MKAGAHSSHTYSERYGARSPWLVERWRVALYLIWRTLFALLRPCVFLLLWAGALFFLYRGLSSAPEVALMASPPVSEQFEAALHEVVEDADASARLAVWRRELDQALQVSQPGGPDLLRAESFAASLPALMGREALALYLMRSERRPELMQADLSAMPVWRRQQIITGVLEARMRSAPQARDAVWLVESAPSVQRRHARMRALYGPGLDAAEDWFHRPQGQSINLASLPGVTREGLEAPVLVLADARELVFQGCALARAHSQHVPACARLSQPLPVADPVRAALALALYDASLEATPVRVALAARAAGRLDGAGIETVLLGSSRQNGEMRLLTALMPILAEADHFASRPETCQTACARAVDEFHRQAGIDLDGRQRWFAAYDTLRREAGALVTVRVSDVLVTADDVTHLARISVVSEGRLLAARLLLGPQLLEIGRSEKNVRPDFHSVDVLIAALLGVLAMLILGIVLISGHFRRLGGPPGTLERLDGEVSRLILGRNL